MLNFVLKKLHLEQFGVFYGYLRASGWIRSLRSQRPSKGNGSPLPWYTYSAIAFLDERLGKIPLENRPVVFEFGSGNSTLWWSNFARKVISVEDNLPWFNEIKKQVPTNVTYNFAHTQNEYIETLSKSSIKFDIIIVDGSYRIECADAAIDKLTDRGILVVDNSEWSSLAPLKNSLKGRGFKQIEFYSLGPCNGHPWGTSIFYRTGNLFDI